MRQQSGDHTERSARDGASNPYHPAALAHSIVETVREPLLILDEDLRVNSANSSFYSTFKVSVEETVGRPLADLGDGQWNIPRLLDSLVEIVATKGSIEDFEVDHEFPRVGRRIMLVNARQVIQPDGQPTLVLLAAEDITAQRRAEQLEREGLARASHAQKLESLGGLAGGIAHDFNNLLVAVLGHAELARMELEPESGAAVHLAAIMQTAKRASELTHQMLAYCGKGQISIRQLSLNRLTEETSHLLEVSVSKKVVLKYNLADSLPLIAGDATQLRQVVMNLIINASEAIGDRSGVVTLSTGVMEADKTYLAGSFVVEDLPAGYYCYFEVADTGCGIAPETLQKIFDPFFSTKLIGRELGLAAALGIVRGHKGALKVYSQPNRGTTFKILLPCVQHEVEPPLRSEERDDAWRGKCSRPAGTRSTSCCWT